MKQTSTPNRRIFEYFQIEVTTKCSLRCIMCPVTVFADRWRAMDMPFETFLKISRYFPYTYKVHLQGWGEPLLNMRIYDMIRVAKDAGCMASLTTNGAYLTEDKSVRMLQLGLDLIAFSFAGSTKETHEKIRVGSDFIQLIDNIRALSRLKQNHGSLKPRIVFSFLATTINVKELPQLIDLAKEVGAEDVVVNNLDYVANSFHDEIRIFSCDSANPDFSGIVQEAERKARGYKLNFRSHFLKTEEALMCEEDPLRNIYISCDGSISPCVYMNLPLQEFPRIFCGTKHLIRRTCFGNIYDTDLFQIWNSQQYQAFREIFKQRLACRTTSFTLDLNAARRVRDAIQNYPLPEACKTCYKAFDI